MLPQHVSHQTRKDSHREIKTKITNSKDMHLNIPESLKRIRENNAHELTTTYKKMKQEKKGIYFNKSSTSIHFSDHEDQDPIVNYNNIQERLYGKYPTKSELIRDTRFGKPSLNHSFTTNADIYNIIIPVAKSGFLNEDDKTKLTNPQHGSYAINHLFQEMKRLSTINFTSLREIDTNYRDYTEIPDEFVDKFAACAIFYDLHMGSVMRYCGNNYINAHIDIDKIKEKCRGIVDDKILNDLIRLFTIGTPAKMQGESTRQNFYDYYFYGNHGSVDKDMKKMLKTLLKEFQNQWGMTLPCWLARFIPNGHMTPEGLIQKPNKKDRPVFDASFLLHWYSVCLNMMTHKDNEPDIHYGETLMNILIRLWNMRITYPLKELLLMCDDIAGAFRHGKYNPEIISAFMYRISKYLMVSTGQNFGTLFAPANFESIAIAREQLAEHLFDDTTLIEKHNDLLSLILFDNTPFNPDTIVPAVADKYNKGVLDAHGKPKKTPHNTFVDDNTIVEIRQRIMQALAAGFEALFIILGFPDETKRKSVIAMDKLAECTCCHKQLTLGMQIDSRRMTITRDPKKISLLRHDLQSWNKHKPTFTLKELASIKGRIQVGQNSLYGSPHQCALCTN